MQHSSESVSPIAVSFEGAAKLTSVSKNTLRRFAKTGKLRTSRVGRRVVIPVDGLKELVGFGAGEEKSPLAESAGAR